jgi:hypothetical protein
MKGMLPTVRADLFADRVGATQLQSCGSPRIMGRESVGNKRRDCLFQVVLHLIAGIPVGGLAVDEHA